ncbi:MAG: PRC-barrel domain-containing protein [Betaproteobacteria bacterium]|nr:PRC-barrel domain-containing protein [Betaproteobacteria bacterium]
MRKALPLIFLLLAATSAPTAGHSVKPPIERMRPGQLQGVLGRRVEGMDGKVMGPVVDVLVDVRGRPRAAVIDFGGYLGVGTRKIAIDWRLLRHWRGPRGAPLRLRLPRADIQAAPQYLPNNGKAIEIVGSTHDMSPR